MKSLAFLLLQVSVLVKSETQWIPKETQEVKTGDAKSLFNVRYLPDIQKVEFYLDMPSKSSYLGLVLGSSDMTLMSDIIVFFSWEQGAEFGDYTSRGFSEP